METETSAYKPNLFLRWGSTVFLAVAFLLPIFFIPSPNVAFQFGKGFFLFAVTLILTVLFLAGVIKEGNISIPKSFTLLGFGAILIAYILSGIFSENPSLSLLGQGFEMDTALFALIGVLLSILVPLAFKQKTSLFNIYIALIAAFFVAALWNIIRFFAPDILSFGVLTTNVSNLVGTWNDLGVFAGFITILSLISLGVLEARGIWRAILYVSLALGVFFLSAVNFNILWWIVAFFSLAFFLYSLSYARHRGGEAEIPARMRQVSWAPVVVLVITIAFLLFGTQLGERLSSVLNTSNIEARPSWSTTFRIAKEVYKENPVFGAGPNQFVGQWLLRKPIPVNESVFWNIDFTSGIGTVPTALVTLGGLGLAAWIIFIGLFLFEGVRAVRRLHGDAFAHYLAFSSFIGSLYLWLIAILYTPTHAMYALAFLFTGVFIATLVLEGVVPESRVNFADNPGKSFVGSLINIVLIIAAVTGIFIAGSRLASFIVFNRAVFAYSQNQDLGLVEASVKRALLFDSNDVFFRTLADIYLARMNELLQKNLPQSEVEATRAEFEGYLGGAIGSAKSATDKNGSNYLNWLSLARVYGSVVPLQIQGAYDEAKKAYDEAVKLNPTSPFIPLSLARLEVSKGDNKKARQYIQQSLSLKNNYTDAVFLLAQIEVAEGNTRRAIEAVSSAALLSPTNPVVFFQLGFLYYNERNWDEGVKAFERAVSLEPQYANAKYFLGLSYNNLGRRNDALKQFEDLNVTNSNNEEVKLILNNLKAGRSPFAAVEPPLDDKPEKRKTPPLSEDDKQPTPDSSE